MVELKKKLIEAGTRIISDKLDALKVELDRIQEAANEETKSSAGDKYETGRAMLMQEKEKLAYQQHELAGQLRVLKQIDPEKRAKEVSPGSLVITPTATYFISIGLGKLTLEGKDYFLVSPGSPIARAMTGKEVNDEVLFNGRNWKITGLD